MPAKMMSVSQVGLLHFEDVREPSRTVALMYDSSSNLEEEDSSSRNYLRPIEEAKLVAVVRPIEEAKLFLEVERRVRSLTGRSSAPKETRK